MSKIFVGNLSYQTTVDGLKDAFKDFKPTDIKILQTPIGYSRGFGFIDFADDEAAKKALEMNKKEVDGRTIRVELATPEEKREEQRKSRSSFRPRYGKPYPPKRRFNRKPKTAHTDIFSSYDVESAIVIRKRYNQKSLGFGFVTLKNAEAQKKAVAEMNGTTIKERKIVVLAAYKKDSEQ
ncbi:Ribonucleoprotein [Entamoeba marina]